jgi:hypothetical protein
MKRALVANLLVVILGCDGIRIPPIDERLVNPFPPSGFVPEVGATYYADTEDGQVVVGVLESEDGTIYVGVQSSLGPPFASSHPIDADKRFSVLFGEIGGTDCPIDGFLAHGVFENEDTARLRWYQLFACGFSGVRPVEWVAVKGPDLSWPTIQPI